jgi:hypothetical protein
VVVLVDYFSRVFESCFLRSTKADKVVVFLEDVFACYGYPEMLRSDNGPQFVAEEFQQYLKGCGIRWISTTPLWPQANGEVERMNRTILKVLKVARSEGRDLERAVREFSMAYHSSPHSGTGLTPYSLMFGREMRTKIPMLNDHVSRSVGEARDQDSLYKPSTKEYADRGTRDSDIQSGDTVVLKQSNRGKLDPLFGSDQYKVVSRQGSDLICKSPSGVAVRRNVSFAKKLQMSSSNDVHAGARENVSDDLIEVSRVPESPRCDFDESVPSKVEVSSGDSVEVTPARRVSTRQRVLPVKFKDYHMD